MNVKYSRRGKEITEEAFNKIVVKFDRVYSDTPREKIRPQLNKMISDVKRGDIIYCYSLGSLANNEKELNNTLSSLIKKDVKIISLKENITVDKESYKIISKIFKGINEMQKKDIGSYLEFKKQYKKMRAKGMSKVDIAKYLGVSRATIYRWIKESKC